MEKTWTFPGMRVFVFDPELKAFSGHHDHMAFGLHNSLQSYGTELRIFGHVSVSRELMDVLSVQPLFSWSEYDRAFDDPYSGYLESFLLGRRRVEKEIFSLGDAGPGDGDLVLFPTATPRQIMGFAGSMARVGRKPMLAALFHNIEPPHLMLEEGSVGGAIYRYAARATSLALARDNILIMATNRRLARKLSRVLDLSVEISPVPMWYSDDPIQHPPAHSQEVSRPQVAFIGHMRPSHGFNIVPAVVRELCSQDPSLRCVISLGQINKMLPLQEYSRLEELGLARILRGWQPEDVLATLVSESTVMVLPYNRRYFRTRVSGVFSGAVASGRPCVVPSGTWMAEQIISGRASGVSYPGGDVKAIAAAILEVINGSEEYLAVARRVAYDWRRLQSGPAFVEQLMSWAQRTGAGVRTSKAPA